MMSFKDNLILASTKLRTRRVRLSITLIMSGLLFSVLIIASLTVRGLVNSITSYTNEGVFKRFYVMTSHYSMSYYQDPSQPDSAETTKILARATTIYEETIAKKTAAAKKMGIPYSSETEDKPFALAEGFKDTSGKTKKMLNPSHPASIQAIKELTDTQAYPRAVSEAASRHGAINTFETHPLSGPIEPISLNAIVGNTEILPSEEIEMKSYSGNDVMQNIGGQITGLNDNMISDLILPGANMSTDDNVIPIVVTTTAAEKLVGLSALSATASSRDQLDHLKQLRTKAMNYSFQGCYRNPAAQNRFAEATAQAKDIATRANEPGYVLPEVVYQIPKDPCLPVVITRDTRNTQTKLIAAKTAEFDSQFGREPAQTSLIKFRIVGLMTVPNAFASGFSISALVQSILTSTQVSSWIVPTSAISQHPIFGKMDIQDSLDVMGGTMRIVEFADREHQKEFITNEGCKFENNDRCDRPTDYTVMPYGNPLAVLYEARSATQNVFIWLLSIIAGLSALITMGTIGKVIADSRKETSVFRALGATRLHIGQIYLVYALMLGVLSFGFAMVVGAIVALTIDIKTTATLSVEAATALNTADLNKQFHLIGWSATDLLLIFGLVLLTALFGALIPLLANVRRNPINDMRSE